MDFITFIRLFLEIVGGLTTLIAVTALIAAIISWFFGVYPLFKRLGLSRWSRKISIVAEGNNYVQLKTDLIDTGVFREKNIHQITTSTLSKVKDASLLLLDYQSFTEQQVKQIIQNKKPTAGMIVYFPNFSPTNRIPDDINKRINNEQFCVLVNYRGRLINDILITLLSTSYEKK